MVVVACSGNTTGIVRPESVRSSSSRDQGEFLRLDWTRNGSIGHDKEQKGICTTLPEATKSVPQFANPGGFEGFAINGGGGDFPSSAPNGDGKG